MTYILNPCDDGQNMYLPTDNIALHLTSPHITMAAQWPLVEYGFTFKKFLDICALISKIDCGLK